MMEMIERAEMKVKIRSGAEGGTGGGGGLPGCPLGDILADLS